MLRMRTMIAAAAILFPALGGHAVAQDDYPTREIRTICPFEAGTGADIFVRFFADRLSRLAGQPVIVENRPGAQGSIATAALANADPDGYTISITPASSTVAAATALMRQVPFDPLTDFDYLTTLGSLSFVVVVDPDLPVKTLEELTAYLKEKGGKANFGSSANTGLVAAELYKEAAGLGEVQRVNYKNVADIVRDMDAGNIDFTVTDATWAVGQVKQGNLRPLAVTSAKRSVAFPDVPTMQESGFEGFDLTPWWGAMVPAGTPEPVKQKLTGWFNQILEDPETVAFLTRAASDPMPGDGASFRARIEREMEAWQRYVDLAKIEPL